jgi:hypothetical protein
VIAAVNGYAIGYGNVLQLLCDLTIAADTAKLGQFARNPVCFWSSRRHAVEGPRDANRANSVVHVRDTVRRRRRA